MDMKRTVLIFGLISGVIASVMMFLNTLLVDRGIVNFDNGEVIGYTAIFLSFLLVFFGIRSYREQHGGTITFGRAFAVDILITLISCVFYVATWEFIYSRMMPDFADKYAAAMVAKMRAKGASDAAIAAKTKEMEQFKVMYRNPFFNVAMTFIEPFPVGLVVTLVSAGILRRRRLAGTVPA
jgi:cyanate permease